MDYELTERGALVTGAATGIGEAAARTLAASGASVLIADVDIVRASAVADSIVAGGGRAQAHEADVTDPSAVKGMVDACVDAFGDLRIAVNNAGIHGDPSNPPIADYPTEWWDRIIGVNLTAVYHCVRAEAQAMRAAPSGSIVNVSSIYGATAKAGLSGYITTKHAVVGLTKAAALDHAEDGIRVNCVSPGFIQTELVDRAVPESKRDEVAVLHALNRLGRPEEVAEVIAFLASDASSFVTATSYPVDSGLLAQ